MKTKVKILYAFSISKAPAKRHDLHLNFHSIKKSSEKLNRLAILSSDSSGLKWTRMKFDLDQKIRVKKLLLSEKSNRMANLSSDSSETMGGNMSF